MSFDEKIRKLSIQALSSNDELFEKLVLKGGNVLAMVYGLNNRTSSDLDYSIQGSLSDDEKDRYEEIIRKTLENTFRDEGFVVFDYAFKEKPKTPQDKDLALFWGGYCLEFKVITKNKFDELGGDLSSIRRQAIPVMQGGSTKMKVEISKFEYTEKAIIKEVDGYAIRVYSPELVVCEKLRAICQQMPEYLAIIKSQTPSPRPRDFFDIYHVASQWGIDLSDKDTQETIKHVFAAKKVPLKLLEKIGDQATHDYHETAFGELEAVVDQSHKLESFLFYFDYTKELIQPCVENLAE